MKKYKNWRMVPDEYDARVENTPAPVRGYVFATRKEAVKALIKELEERAKGYKAQAKRWRSLQSQQIGEEK